MPGWKRGENSQLATTGSIDSCGQIDTLLFGSSQLIGARYDPDLFNGWGLRPADWSFGAGVAQYAPAE